MTELLKEHDALERGEQTAWAAWFNGGMSNVTQYQNRPDQVFMGKAECEWVSFTDFWLGKMVNLGWMTAEVKEEGHIFGDPKEPKWIQYKLWPTDKGWDIREAEIARWKERVASMEKAQ